MSIFKVGKSWYYIFVHNGDQIKRTAEPGATKQEASKLGEQHREHLRKETKVRKLGSPISKTFGDAALEFIKQATCKNP